MSWILIPQKNFSCFLFYVSGIINDVSLCLKLLWVNITFMSFIQIEYSSVALGYCVLFHCVNLPQSISSFNSLQKFEMYLVWGSHKWHCFERSLVSFGVHMHFCWIFARESNWGVTEYEYVQIWSEDGEATTWTVDFKTTHAWWTV